MFDGRVSLLLRDAVSAGGGGGVIQGQAEAIMRRGSSEGRSDLRLRRRNMISPELIPLVLLRHFLKKNICLQRGRFRSNVADSPCLRNFRDLLGEKNKSALLAGPRGAGDVHPFSSYGSSILDMVES